MPKMSRPGRRPGRRPAGRSRKGYRKALVPRRIKSYVKQAIHSQLENKELVKYAVNTNIVTASTLTDPWNFNLLAAPGIGSAAGQREGVVLRPRPSCRMKLTFNLKPYDALSNPSIPIWVRVWVVSYKVTNVNSAAMSGVYAGFFEEGSSTVNFQSNMLDMMLPVNKNLWTVYMDRKFKLGVGSTGTGYSGAGVVYDNSPFSRSMTINFGKWLKAPLKYIDAAGNYPNNRNMWIVVQAVNAEGTSSSVTPCEVHYAHHFVYEDA